MGFGNLTNGASPSADVESPSPKHLCRPFTQSMNENKSERKRRNLLLASRLCGLDLLVQVAFPPFFFLHSVAFKYYYYIWRKKAASVRSVLLFSSSFLSLFIPSSSSFSISPPFLYTFSFIVSSPPIRSASPMLVSGRPNRCCSRLPTTYQPTRRTLRASAQTRCSIAYSISQFTRFALIVTERVCVSVFCPSLNVAELFGFDGREKVVSRPVVQPVVVVGRSLAVNTQSGWTTASRRCCKLAIVSESPTAVIRGNVSTVTHFWL